MALQCQVRGIAAHTMTQQQCSATPALAKDAYPPLSAVSRTQQVADKVPHYEFTCEDLLFKQKLTDRNSALEHSLWQSASRTDQGSCADNSLTAVVWHCSVKFQELLLTQ